MIELKQVYLNYPLMGHYSHSLQSHIGRKIGGVFGSGKNSDALVDYVQALKNISIKIEDGSRLGIIGHNGAGKTTLLRVMTGVYPPTSGVVKIKGRVNALTDFTLGMEPNATGFKNIIFRLVFMGYSFAEANAAVDEIVDFSGLDDFINLPVRTYSTGMFMRLAFAISTHFTPDILVLDEVIGAGDESFRIKAKERLDSIIMKSRIVILSSHDLSSVKGYCDKALLLKKGELVSVGKSEQVVSDYLESV